MANSTSGSSSSSGRNSIPIANKYDRIVILVDMDCFFCQVEERLNPTLRGKPIAVVQYNSWRGGVIIAVNYAARNKGVTRHMRGDEATLRCPDIVLVKVPNLREKADLSKYRDAGKEVANVLQRFTTLMERASVDEAYLDVTDKVNQRLEDMTRGTYMLEPEKLLNTYAVGYDNFGDYVNRITTRFLNPNVVDNDDDEQYVDVHDVIDLGAVRQSDLRLLLGASIAGEIRAAVKAETTYECSAGIAHNKILAKLACGINKPNKQTLLPLNQIPKLFDTLPIGKITGLGGKFGEDVCERLKIRFVGQLLRFTKAELQKKFDEKNGLWLYNMCRGIDLDAVTPRFYSKSIGCCKKFPGRNNITGINTLRHWMTELAKEICDRLEKDTMENNRRARQMVVSYVQHIDGEEISSSRSAPLANYESETIVRSGLELIKANTKQFYRVGSESILNNEIRFLGFSVGKFETIVSGQSKLQEMFAHQATKKRCIESREIVAENVGKAAITEISSKQLDNTNSIKKLFLKTMNKAESNTLNNKQCVGGTVVENVDDIPTSSTNQISAAKTQLITESDAATSSNGHDLGKDALISDSEKPSHHSYQDRELANLKANELFKMQESELIASRSRSFFHKFLAKQQVATEHNETKVSNDKQLHTHETNKQLPMIDGLELLAATKRKHSEHDDSTMAQDYTTEYVEYAIPQFRPELLQFVKCDICHAEIPADQRSQQTHQDEHLAQQLSQQQRIEYRAEIKNKILQNNLTTQKALKKSKTTPKKCANGTDIKKFLKPTITSSLQLSDNCELSFNCLIVCEICNKPIKESDVQEHRDYHVAKELHKQLNPSTQIQINTLSPPASNAKAHKSPPNGNANKSIASYFSQPSV